MEQDGQIGFETLLLEREREREREREMFRLRERDPLQPPLGTNPRVQVRAGQSII